MISSFFKVSLYLLILFSSPSWAEKVQFSEFCDALDGEWLGSAAKLKQPPSAVSVSALCSADKRQLVISVSQNANKPFSETWWFRLRGQSAFLTYFDGINTDKTQYFSLYKQYGSYTLLGEGVLNKRPALIQLRFELKEQGWLWLQNVQYLDDDTDRYLFYRGIEMQPAQ